MGNSPSRYAGQTGCGSGHLALNLAKLGKKVVRSKKVHLTLFRGANALLYLGPLLAGLSGFGWALVPGFLAIFLMYLFVVRRSLFPRKSGDWTDMSVVIPLLTHTLVQLLLIVLCFAIGRGLGGIVGALPAFSPLWTLAVSFLSVPLCRWLAIQSLPTVTGPDAPTAR